jgi:hypothetical protein
MLNILRGFSLGIAAAWLLEANTVGRGPVSQYLAPVAIVLILFSAVVSIASKKRRATQ